MRLHRAAEPPHTDKEQQVFDRVRRHEALQLSTLVCLQISWARSSPMLAARFRQQYPGFDVVDVLQRVRQSVPWRRRVDGATRLGDQGVTPLDST
jgi:hypothetical protein